MHHYIDNLQRTYFKWGGVWKGKTELEAMVKRKQWKYRLNWEQCQCTRSLHVKPLFCYTPKYFMTPALHTDKIKVEQCCIYHCASALWELHTGHRITGWKSSSPVSKQSANWTSPRATQWLNEGRSVLTEGHLLMDSTCRLNDGSVHSHTQPRANTAGHHQHPQNG